MMSVITKITALLIVATSLYADLGDSKMGLSRRQTVLEDAGQIVHYKDDTEGRTYAVIFNERNDSIAEIKSASSGQQFTEQEQERFVFSNTGVSRVSEITAKHRLRTGSGFIAYDRSFNLRINEKALTDGTNLFLIVGPTRLVAFRGIEGMQAYYTTYEVRATYSF